VGEILKKFAVALAFALLGSLLTASPVRAWFNTLPVCAVDNSRACIESVSIRGAGLADWLTLGQPTSVTDGSGTTHLYDTANTAYSPSQGYGTIVSVEGNAFTLGNYYTVNIGSSNGSETVQAYGTYIKELDPETEVKLVLNTKSVDTSTMLSMNRSAGSDRVYSKNGEDHIVTISAKVTRSGQTSADNYGNWNLPSVRVSDGELGLTASSTSVGSGGIYEGMVIDHNASVASTPNAIQQYTPYPSVVYFDGFSVMLKAPHTLTDGATLNTGYYSAIVPEKFLSMMNLTQAQVLTFGVSLTADYTDGKGVATPIQAIVEPAANGGVKIKSVGLHYSTPTVGTKFLGLPQSAKVKAAVKKGKKITLPLKSTQGIATSWKSKTPKICKVKATKKVTKKKVGKKTVKTVTIKKWQVQGKKKGTCTVVGTNAGNGTFGPASISKTIRVR